MTRKTEGVIVSIPTIQDHLPDLQRIRDGEYSDPEVRYLSTGLLSWAITEIGYLRLLNKRHRELDEAS